MSIAWNKVDSDNSVFDICSDRSLPDFEYAGDVVQLSKNLGKLYDFLDRLNYTVGI